MANCEFPFFLRPSLGAFSQPKRTEIASFTRGTLIRFCGHSVGNSVPIKNTPISTLIGERYLSEEPEVECFTQLAKNNRFSEKYVNSEYLQVKVESFIRWAGGKKWLCPYLEQLISSVTFSAYHEPFVGGGAVFFYLNNIHVAYLSDLNQDLINAYRCIKAYPYDVINILKLYKNTKDDYYAIRDQDPKDEITRAARFIFLNQTSFNGLYRVNNNGKYNVPYGFRHEMVYDYERIVKASKKLQGVEIFHGDFEQGKEKINKNDLVFLDPPYAVSKSNGFVKYNEKLFSIKDQYRLLDYAEYVNSIGAYYVITNAYHEEIFSIFGNIGATIHIERSSTIGGKKAKRGKIGEYIFTNIPGAGELYE